MEKIDTEVNQIPPEEDAQANGFLWSELTEEQKQEFEAKSKASRKKEAAGKMKRDDLYRAVVAAMNGDFMAEPWKKFPYDFKIVRGRYGESTQLQADNADVLSVVLSEVVKTAIVEYIRKSPHIPIFPSRAVVDEIFEYWRRSTTVLKESDIKNVRQLSKPGYTYRRLPWDLSDGPTPLFDEMMARTSNSEAVQDFIGSLFFDEADRQTYVWIYGKGGDGKGSIVRVLEKVFGSAFSSQLSKFFGKYSAASLISKRLVVFPECEDPQFVSSGFFKSITGNDQLPMERKNEPPFSGNLTAMFIFLSNERPHLTLSEADMRRVIFANMQKPTEHFENYESRLWDEAQHFLWKCVKGYRLRHPHFEPIVADRSEVIDLAEHQQEYNQMIFNTYFKHCPLKSVGRESENPHVSADVVQKMMVTEKMNFMEKRGFTKFLKDIKGYENKPIKSPTGVVYRAWIGFTEKSHSEKGGDIAVGPR